jgi:glutaredoxin
MLFTMSSVPLHQVVLYTRERCSLCRAAKAAILAVRREVSFAFREVDIGWSGELYEEHKHDIPVVEIDGKRAFKHRVDPAALKKRLSA